MISIVVKEILRLEIRCMLGTLAHMWIRGKNGHQVKSSSLLDQFLVKCSQRWGPSLEDMLITSVEGGQNHWIFLQEWTRIRAVQTAVNRTRQPEGQKLQHHSECLRTPHQGTLVRTI